MNKMRELREAMGISMREAANRLSMPYTTYVNYEKGLREPNSETLITIALFFDVTIDYLLGKTENNTSKKPTAEGSELDKQLEGVDFALYGEVKDLTEAQKRDVLRFIQFLKQEE